jgi:hypothetical protein
LYGLSYPTRENASLFCLKAIPPSLQVGFTMSPFSIFTSKCHSSKPPHNLTLWLHQQESYPGSSLHVAFYFPTFSTLFRNHVPYTRTAIPLMLNWLSASRSNTATGCTDCMWRIQPWRMGLCNRYFGWGVVFPVLFEPCISRCLMDTTCEMGVDGQYTALISAEWAREHRSKLNLRMLLEDNGFRMR